MIEVKYVVAWGTHDAGRGWGREFRTFSSLAKAEQFYEELNNRSDCFEGYLSEIKEDLHA